VGCYQKGQRVWIGETGLRNVSCLKIVENSNCVSQGWPQSASQSVPDLSIDTSDASCRIPLIGGQAHTNQQDRQSWPWWWMRPVQQRCEESEANCHFYCRFFLWRKKQDWRHGISRSRIIDKEVEFFTRSRINNSTSARSRIKK
jgi:hypothetical protein